MEVRKSDIQTTVYFHGCVMEVFGLPYNCLGSTIPRRFDRTSVRINLFDGIPKSSELDVSTGNCLLYLWWCHDVDD